MRNKLITISSLTIACLLSGQCLAYNYWGSGIGGDYNIPPKEYNYDHHSYSSKGQTLYNQIDLHDGQAMQITGGSLYDNKGNKIGTAKASMIGYYNGTKDGGISAGSITSLKVNGRTRRVIFVKSVNTAEGGRRSGWVLANNFTPKDKIKQILKQTKQNRMALIQDDVKSADYMQMVVKAAFLPSEAAGLYLVPEQSSTATRTKRFFTMHGLIAGLKDLPQTGSQRYGAVHDVAPVGAFFYKDKNVAEVKMDLYQPNSSTPSGYSLKFIWGYFINSSGKRWHSWVNSAAIEQNRGIKVDIPFVN